MSEYDGDEEYDAGLQTYDMFLFDDDPSVSNSFPFFSDVASSSSSPSRVKVMLWIHWTQKQMMMMRLLMMPFAA